MTPPPPRGTSPRCAQGGILLPAGQPEVGDVGADERVKDPAVGRKMLNGEWSKMFPDPASRPARHTLVLGASNPNHVTCDFVAVIG